MFLLFSFKQDGFQRFVDFKSVGSGFSIILFCILGGGVCMESRVYLYCSWLRELSFFPSLFIHNPTGSYLESFVKGGREEK